MGLLELCEKYFETTNLYEVLQISEKATDKEVKKAYHKLSLKVHPDRVAEEEKLEATEKFKVLGSIHAILTDTSKRALYDETKCVDDDDYNVIVDRDWSVYWRLLFKKITDEDIRAYEKEYVGSDLEKQEIKQAYITGKGDMDYIVDHVQFARSEQEPRIRDILNMDYLKVDMAIMWVMNDRNEIVSNLKWGTRGEVDEMIQNGEIPAYKIFTHEPAKKRLRRLAKENREAKEAEEMKEELGVGSGPNSLELMIRQKQENRAAQLDNFIDNLAAKYGAGTKKGSKRKSAAKAETTTKSKRRR